MRVASSIDDRRALADRRAVARRAVLNGLREALNAGQRRLQFVRDIRQEIALRLLRAAHLLRHLIEITRQFFELARAFHRHGLIVIARRDFLRGLRHMLHGPHHRSGDEDRQDDRDGKGQHQRNQQRLQQCAKDRIVQAGVISYGTAATISNCRADRELAGGIQPVCAALRRIRRLAYC